MLGNRGDCSEPYIDFRMTRTGALISEVTDYGCSGYVPAVTDPEAGTVNDGNWHLLANMRQATQIQVYIDGALRATGTAGGTASSPTSRARTSSPSAPTRIRFNGTIDGLQIYDRALSAFELQTPSQKLSSILSTILSYNLSSGTETALKVKDLAALAAVDRGLTATAVKELEALIHLCEVQSGKKLTVAQVNELISLATQTITSLQ